jgi:hypothetical protein
MRRVALIAVLAALALSVTATASAAPDVSARSAEPLAPSIWKPPIPRRIRLPKLPRLPRLPPGVLLVHWTSIVDDLEYAYSSPQARDALARLYRRDGYKKVLVDGFCNGMSWLSDQPSQTRVSNRSWNDYLLDFFAEWWEQHLLRYIEPRIVQSVDDWMTAFDMAQISPQAAYMYVRACIGP